jgi:hypothetical protein
MRDAHIDDEQLELYALGRTPEEPLPAIEEHLLVCEDCQNRLAQADEFAALFHAAATQPEARPQPRRWLIWGRLGAVGMAAAAMAGVIFVASERGRESGAPLLVEMRAMRGPEAPAQIDGGRAATLLLDIDAAGGAEGYSAQIVDGAGAEAAKPRVYAKDGRLAVTISRLRKGTYWVRIFRSNASDPVVEYGLQAR